MIFDSHSHYDDERFNEDRDIILSSLSDKGVEKLVDVCASFESIQSVLELVKKYDFIYGAVGVHPDNVGELDEEKFDIIEKAANENKIIAVGEIGLDYYWDEAPRDIQKYWFERQLDLAEKINKPFIIHSREACADTMEILHKRKNLNGVMHCYSYSAETAKELIAMGMMFGIGGVVTFKNAKKLVEAVEIIPIDRILLETDCPYLAPEPFRGKRNDSSLIKYVIEKIADIKGMLPSEVESICYNNTMKFFGL